MKKRIVSTIAALLLLMPVIIQAASVTTQEDFFPGDPLVTMDFSITGKLKTLLEPLLQNELVKEKTGIIIKQLLDGKRFFVSFTDAESIAVSFPVSDEQWDEIKKDAEKETYGSTEIYNDDVLRSYAARLGEFMVLTPITSKTGIQKIIDLATGSSTDSLSNNPKYKDMASSYLNPRLFSFTIDINKVNELLAKELENANGKSAESILSMTKFLNLIQFEGGSFAEKADGNGYKFNIKIEGNADALAKEGLGFNPGGSFVPNLYKVFPNAKPIFYTELFNEKANFTMSKKFVAADAWDKLKQATGVDLEKVLNTFDQEVGFAVQYDQSSILPYITLLGNVKNNKDAGVQLGNDLANTITNFFESIDMPPAAYSVVKKGNLTVITLDITKSSKNYKGPTFPLIVLTFGVNDDGLFIASNYPDIDNASKRTGFASDPDFAVYSSDVQGKSAGITYFNARSTIQWVDSIIDWTVKNANPDNALSLSDLQTYYAAIEKIYGWKDLFFINNATDTEGVITGTVNIDDAKHSAFSDLVSSLKSTASSDDDYSYYDKAYIYHTNDVGEIKNLPKGLNADGKQIFKDVSQEGYYTKDVSLLKKKGAISGYPDGTFRPSKNVSRAEFAAMVVKAFEEQSGSLSFNNKTAVSLPFLDVSKGAWYYTPILKAYSRGFIAGGYDAKRGGLTLRPDSDITRAEAVVILGNASRALSKAQQQINMQKCAPGKFTDVPTNEWYCKAVMNAYQQGVTAGKTPSSFKPLDFMSRGEAAVMIERSMEIDIEEASKPGSFSGTFSPVLRQSIGNLN